MADDPHWQDSDPYARDRDRITDPARELPLPTGQRNEELAAGFADTGAADRARLASSFADPNSLDDGRLGDAFEEANSTHKRRKQREHEPPKHHMTGTQKSKLWTFVVVALVLFLIVFLLGWLPRHHREEQTRQVADQEQDRKPVVAVMTAQHEPATTGLVVPGTTIPAEEAFVYARANGYLQKRYVDIGDHVRKGQVLAVVDAPDLDAQVAQAREQLRQAQSQLEQQRSQLALASVTVDRYRVLVAKGVFSRQQGDQQEATYASEQANVAAAQRNVQAFQANLQRVIALQSYERVTAPFSGVITQRNADVGALVSAGGANSGAPPMTAPTGQMSSNGGSQQPGSSNNAGSSGSVNTAATPSQSPGQGGPLFGIAKNDTLRILVSVPEAYTGSIHDGMRAQLNFTSYPNHSFFGTVTRSAGELDQNTRTLLTEIDVDNHANMLLPGMYAIATFPPVKGEAPIMVPGDAVVVRNSRSMVAVVRDGKVHLQPVTLGRDFGSVVQIQSGLRDGDQVATDVTDDVTEGAEVQAQQSSSNSALKPSPPPQPQPQGGNSQYGNPGITDQNLQNKQQQQNQKGAGGKAQKPSNEGSKP